jgi:hypothetical protein
MTGSKPRTSEEYWGRWGILTLLRSHGYGSKSSGCDSMWCLIDYLRDLNNYGPWRSKPVKPPRIRTTGCHLCSHLTLQRFEIDNVIHPDRDQSSKRATVLSCVTIQVLQSSKYTRSRASRTKDMSFAYMRFIVSVNPLYRWLSDRSPRSMFHLDRDPHREDRPDWHVWEFRAHIPKSIWMTPRFFSVLDTGYSSCIGITTYRHETLDHRKSATGMVLHPSLFSSYSWSGTRWGHQRWTDAPTTSVNNVLITPSIL